MGFPVESPDIRKTRYTLERLGIGIHRIVPEGDWRGDLILRELKKIPQVLNTLRLSSRQDSFLRGMVFDLVAWVCRDRDRHETGSKTVTKTLSLPGTWWDMLKQHPRFPKWFSRRHPPRMVSRSFDFTIAYEQEIRVCPHADIAFQDPLHMEFLAWQTPSDLKDGTFAAIEDVLAKHCRGRLGERTTPDNIASILDSILTIDTRNTIALQDSKRRIYALETSLESLAYEVRHLPEKGENFLFYRCQICGSGTDGTARSETPNGNYAKLKSMVRHYPTCVLAHKED